MQLSAFDEAHFREWATTHRKAEYFMFDQCPTVDNYTLDEAVARVNRFLEHKTEKELHYVPTNHWPSFWRHLDYVDEHPMDDCGARTSEAPVIAAVEFWRMA